MNGVNAGAACGNPATKSGGSGGGDSRRVYKRARESSTPASKVRGATAFGWIEIKLLHGIDSIIDCYIGEISQIQKSETSTPGWEQKFRLVFDASHDATAFGQLHSRRHIGRERDRATASGGITIARRR